MTAKQTTDERLAEAIPPARLATTDRVDATDRAGTDNGSGVETVAGEGVWDEATFKRLFEEGQELRAAFERQVAGMRGGR